MPKPRFRLYLAMSLDGYIATPDGGVAWLNPFDAEEAGYRDFLAGIGTIVMGRKTYDQALTFGPWAWPGKRTLVMTHRPLGEAPAGVEAWSGDVAELARDLGEDSRGDVWLMGGASSVRPFLQAGLVDTLELAMIPILLGDGIRLFGRGTPSLRLSLKSTTPHANGLVMLEYERR